MTRGGRLAREAVAPGLLLALLLAYAALLHHGFGPRPQAPALPWWAPRGFLTEALLDSRLAPLAERVELGLALFLLPALGLCAGLFASTRSLAARTLALAAVLASVLWLYYGLGRAQIVWRLFHWRGSAVMGLLGLVAALSALSPWLARAWLRLGWPARIVCYAPLLLAVLFLERNLTGTNPELLLAVSPWPAVPVLGLEVVASALAAEFAGMALGLAGLRRLLHRAAPAQRALGLAWLGLGVAFPTLAVWIASQGALLPFRVGPGAIRAAGLLCLAGILLAAGLPPWASPPARLRRRARSLATAAVLAGIPLLAGQRMVLWDYTETRNVRGGRLIRALADYYERNHLYPDSLAELVETGDLESVPRLRIGFGRREFTYQNFGSSYLLEFAAPRWVQCAYSPPYAESEPGEALAGAWSCPARPPELW